MTTPARPVAADRSPSRSTGPGRWAPPLVGGIVLLALAAALGVVVLVEGNGPFAIDDAWNDLLAGWTSDVVLAFSWVMNDVGGGWIGSLVVPVGIAVVLVLVRGPWSAAYFLAASAASGGTVQVLKHLFGRARPEDIIVVSDFGSFPSGHTANAATMAVALFVLFPRLLIALAGIVWVLLMAFSRTYLHAHWLSDTLGGGLAGAGAALVVTAAFATPIAAEAARRAVRARAAAGEERMPRRGATEDSAGRRTTVETAGTPPAGTAVETTGAPPADGAREP